MLSSTLLLGAVLAASPFAYAATRQFYVEVAWGNGAPDGFERQMIFVNGTSPGPALIVDQGDNVEFYVKNNLDRVTTLHFHGIEQLDTPWSDGTPGLAQKPIAVGGDWLYKWTATEYGAYWYHGHYQSQVTDGFYGPIYIRPSASVEKPFAAIEGGDQAAITAAEDEPQFAMIADWNHVTSDELYQIESDTNIDVYCAQSILFNGQGRVTCLTEEQQSAALAPPFKDLYNGPLSGTKLTPAGCAPFIPFTQRPGPINPTGLPQTITGCTPTQSELHNFEVQACKKYANFHLMSAASILAPVVSLDEHDMWVYAIDGRYVEPYKVNAVQIFNGDRYSVMVPLDKEPGSYTFRANHFGFNQLIGGFASVTYSQTCDGGNNNTGNGTDVGHIGGGDGGGGELPPTYGQPMHYGSPPSPSAPSAPSYPAAGVKPNGKTGYDCGIPRHTVGGCYSANEPDWKSNMAPMPEPPRVPSEYDWIGPLPPPQPTTYTTYQPSAEQTGVPSYETPADTPTSPQPAPYGTLNNSNSALPASSGCPKSSYAKRADQHRGRLWKRQSPTPTPGNSTESKPWITYGGFPVDSSVILLNETDVVPFPNIPPPQEVSQTHIFAMSRTTAPWLWKVGGESYASKPQEYAEDAPLLYYPESVNAQNDNLVITTQNNTWVDLIFTVPDAFGPPHPMHKHANKAYVIGRGTGNFTWNNVAEAAAAQPQNFNFDSPQLRDGYATAPSQGQPVWLAIRYHVNNPGAWMLHCHVQTHLTGGMAVALLEGVGQFPEFPLEYATADSTGLGPASRPLASSPS